MSKLKRLFNWRLTWDNTTWPDEPVWIFIQGPYLYMHTNLFRLAMQVTKEWQHNKHLVG